MRGVTLCMLILLCACSPRGSTGVGSGPPGIDVADAALKGGSPEIALQISDSLLARHPGNEAVLLTRGEALTALGRPDEAAANFAQALAANPDSVGAHIGLGRLKLSTDPVAAEALFLEALQHEPRNAVALNDLGIARDLQGRHKDAQTAYREALGVDSDMPAAQVNLALSLAMSGQSGDAVQLLQPLADKPGAPQQLRHDMAAVLTMGGDRAQAAEILSKDLPPDQVQQALDAFSAAGKRPGGAAELLSPAPPTALATPPPAAAPAAPKAAAVVQVQVELAGPTPSKNAAASKWQRLRNQMPSLLDDRQPDLAEVTEGSRTVWRVRTGGFDSIAQANAFCEHVRSTGTTCRLIQ